MSSGTDLQVTVYGGGYRWVRTVSMDTPQEEDEFISTGLMFWHDLFHPRNRTYNPLEKSALFREFADTKPTKDGVKEFADEYGLLGGKKPEEERYGKGILLPDAPKLEKLPWEVYAGGEPAGANGAPRPAKSARVPAGYGESFSFWANEIREMKEAVDLWDCVRAKKERNDSEELNQRFLWTEHQRDDPVLLYRPVWWTKKYAYRQFSLSELAVSSPKGGGVRLRGFEVQPSDVVMPALIRIHDLVNERLWRSLTPIFIWSNPFEDAAFSYSIPNLRTALWYQFARAVISGKTQKTCAECGKWFEIASSLNQDRHRYCSNTCRQKAYRKRKANTSA